MWNWISCYVTGHDYSISCNDGAMFLRCVVCNRRSQGWVVHGSQEQAHVHTPPQPHAHVDVTKSLAVSR